MSNEDFKFDFRGLLVAAQNNALNRMVVSTQQNAETAEAVAKVLAVCNKHGVTTETILKILMELYQQELEGSENDSI